MLLLALCYALKVEKKRIDKKINKKCVKYSVMVVLAKRLINCEPLCIGYLRTSISSRVFHQIVDFLTKSSLVFI